MNEFSVQRHTLPGGLRTILLPRKEVQTVTFLVLIGVGSRFETPRQSGLSHFLEHMFFKGTSTRPTTKEIAEAIENVGGEFNAFTGEEYTGYYVKVAAEHLLRGAEVVSDILLHPLFPQEEIERERGVIIEEIRMYTDMPMRHVHHLWQEALFGSHPLGRRVDGLEETVSKFMRKDFVSYSKSHYHTKNAVVTVAGNFDPVETEKLLKRLFAELQPGQAAKPKSAPRRSPAQNFVHEYRKHIDQTHIMVGAPGLSHTDDRRYAAELLAIILGGGMSSRLFLEVRERHGLAYAVRTSLDSYVDAGSFVTQAGVRSDKADLALRLILQEYDTIMENGVTPEELTKAKEMFKGHLKLELEETNALALFSAGQELLANELLTPQQMWEKVEAVTAEDVKKVAQQLLPKKLRAVAMISSHKNTKAFTKLLK
jgi:predicted Zn-dependent peptidase